MSAAALQLIDKFANNPLPGAFIWLNRANVAFGLADRVANPSLINQGQAGLCGGAAVVYALARTQPVEYVRAVTELFDRGETKLGKWNLKPCADLRSYHLPVTAKIPQCDWIILASLRDSANWFFDYQSESDRGGTTASEVGSWLRKTGYSDVREELNDFANTTAANLQRADELYSKGYQVCLRIDSDLLKGKTALVSMHNHWVVLASNITAIFASPSSSVSMKVFTWGSVRDLPANPMNLDDFTDYYYGYIAAKY